ncbi:hypothetical protein J8F10_17460 [Gemmata sp. G18]|uniref:Uncharacterized protein n=1 Tax=Gemmata palustris TaxID=2822762 RepID=A0ABS5BVY4_9BACT|nr:hypothetical protein [Gemmata palustris]MBP3957058.1 hypothetical protein [Gemmata palustris]
MTPASQQPDPNERDLLRAYAEGDRAAARAVRPDEPTEPEWDAVYQSVRARLRPVDRVPEHQTTHWRAAVLIATGAAFAAVAAALAWVAWNPALVEKPELVDVRPAHPSAPEAPHVPDPLADFAVLPMATAEEVDFHRVPGSGWFPVGTDPLPNVLKLATTDEVELDDPNPAWPQVTPSPGDAPIIFAAKPR